MATRAQLHRRRSNLARAWDLHIPAICDKRLRAGDVSGATDRYGGELLGSSESDPQPAAVQRYLELAPHDLELLGRTPAAGNLPTANLARLTISASH